MEDISNKYPFGENPAISTEPCTTLCLATGYNYTVNSPLSSVIFSSNKKPPLPPPKFNYPGDGPPPSVTTFSNQKPPLPPPKFRNPGNGAPPLVAAFSYQKPPLPPYRFRNPGDGPPPSVAAISNKKHPLPPPKFRNPGDVRFTNMDEKRIKKTMLNRISAQQCRMRKGQYVDGLEKKAKDLEAQSPVLLARIQNLLKLKEELQMENRALKQDLRAMEEKAKLASALTEERQATVSILKELFVAQQKIHADTRSDSPSE